MHRHVTIVLLGLFCCATAWSQTPTERGTKAAKGEIKGPFAWNSEIFPGTERSYWIYVPATYDAKKPACLLVVQDGLSRARDWNLPAVMDQLIHDGDMPVTIGLFIDPGIVPAPNEQAQPRFNRSFEYDSLGDRYARFLLDEMLPQVGEDYDLSNDPNDRAIAGASSGAICAFTVAWERPDQFRRVLSTIGTYVGLRGGNIYPTWIRKMEPKPIRVFLEDGSEDLNIYGGDWWMANQAMQRALTYAGYDVNHAWGDLGHSGHHAREILPDALRWLWRDYPQPIKANEDHSGRRLKLLMPGEPWRLVSEGHRFTEGPAVNAKGEVYFSDIPNGRIHRVDGDGRVSLFAENSPGVNGLMFDANGYLYACQNGRQRIVRYDSEGTDEIILSDAPSNDLVTFPRGGYYTDPSNHKVWYVNRDGARRVVEDKIDFPNGIILSPDRTLLYVSDTHGRFVYSYQIRPDGTLAHRQVYGYLHRPDDSGRSGADGMTIDTEGRLYVTTQMGLQVLDQLGRVNLIITKPQDAWLSNVVFGGPNLDTLYVTCGDKVYSRRVAARGSVSWQSSDKPPKPRL